MDREKIHYGGKEQISINESMTMLELTLFMFLVWAKIKTLKGSLSLSSQTHFVNFVYVLFSDRLSGTLSQD